MTGTYVAAACAPQAEGNHRWRSATSEMRLSCITLENVVLAGIGTGRRGPQGLDGLAREREAISN